VLDLACLAVAAMLVYSASYELFIDVPGQHYARVHLVDGAVDAYANVPTLTAAILLVLGVLLALLPIAGRGLRVGQRAGLFVVGFGVALFVELWAMMDVLGNAFDGVG
jgi:hypothetical protein